MGRTPRQIDLFIASATDVAPKEQQDLSRGWWNLSKQKRIEPIEHRFGDSYVKITGDPKYGIATIWDNDILLFAISQLMHNHNHGLAVGRRLQFTGYEFWTFTGKKRKSGKGYKDLWASLERLHHTYVETNIRQGNKSRQHSFVWLSDIKQNHDGTRHTSFEITLPEWLYDSVINDNFVLTLDDGYFDIRGGLERWLYLFARKSSGYNADGWVESIESIHKKSGSKTTIHEFRRQIRKILTKGKLLGYDIGWSLEAKKDRRGWRNSNLFFARNDPKLIHHANGVKDG